MPLRGGAPVLLEAALDTILPLSRVNPAEVERLLDAAFGADRRGRTAYALRAGTAPVPALSFAAVDEADRLAGTLQTWPVQIVPDRADAAVPLLLVGPVAVAPARQRSGLGSRLMAALLDAWDGTRALTLIGDPEYYERFGFVAAPTQKWQLPGPVERHRLLVRAGRDALPTTGALGPRG